MSEQAPAETPVTLKWAVWLLAVETLVVAAATGYLIYLDLAATAQNQSLAMFMTFYSGAYTVGFGIATWGLARHSRWARTPALVLNLFGLPIGWFLLQAGLWLAGLVVLGYSLLVAWLLLVRPTRQALGIH